MHASDTHYTGAWTPPEQEATQDVPHRLEINDINRNVK